MRAYLAPTNYALRISNPEFRSRPVFPHDQDCKRPRHHLPPPRRVLSPPLLAGPLREGGGAAGSPSERLHRPSTNANGTTTVNNGDFGLIAGQVITVNTEGAFFKSTYNGMSLTTDRGRIPGGTQQAQVFVDLHELAHSTLESSSAYLRDNNNQNAVNRNDRALETHCSKTIKAAK